MGPNRGNSNLLRVRVLRQGFLRQLLREDLGFELGGRPVVNFGTLTAPITSAMVAETLFKPVCFAMLWLPIENFR